MSFKSIFNKDINQVYIIAEIGGNFTTYEQGVKLIDAAVSCGVDCIKLQTYRAETLSCRSAFFDMENTGKISQYDFFKKYELSREMHQKIFNYVSSKKVDWFSTPSHSTDVDMLASLDMPAYKIGADDAVNLPFLKYIAKLGKPIFFSTGMCTLEEIRQSVACILEEGNDQLIIFHTVSGYPTHPEHVNLRVLQTLQREFPDFPIGFSDHTLTPTACIAAASMGARVLERHFTLDKKAEGPDHMLSSTPDEMKYLVDSVRTIEKMMGSSVKMPFGPEVKNRINNRKSLTALHAIKKGEILSEENIGIKRPGSGIAPMHYESFLGKRAAMDIPQDQLLRWCDV